MSPDLLLAHCDTCGIWRGADVAVCSQCGSLLRSASAPAEGRVRSSTTRTSREQPDLVIALVELDCGPWVVALGDRAFAPDTRVRLQDEGDRYVATITDTGTR